MQQRILKSISKASEGKLKLNISSWSNNGSLVHTVYERAPHVVVPKLFNIFDMAVPCDILCPIRSSAERYYLERVMKRAILIELQIGFQMRVVRRKTSYP